jgi:cytosine/adenosine deaminase-related metal-dependent hydrolase
VSGVAIRADILLPIGTPSIRHGILDIDDDRIAAVRETGPFDRHLPGVILPGLVNAHTHLELSHLRGKLPRGTGLPAWIAPMVAAREAPEETILSAAREAIAELVESGTAAAGDISNTDLAAASLMESSLAGVLFAEVFGLLPGTVPAIVSALDARLKRLAATVSPDRFRVRPALHAPYSVSPELAQAVTARIPFGEAGATSIHLAESPDEMRLFRDRSGGFTRLFRGYGIDERHWPPAGTDPIARLAELGVLRPGTIAVHVTQLDPKGIERLRALGVSAVLCPGSNRFIGVGDPPIRQLLDAGVTVGLGTDSLASNDDLDLFREMREGLGYHPDVRPSEWLRMATLGGARALGLDDRFGFLGPGATSHALYVEDPTIATRAQPPTSRAMDLGAEVIARGGRGRIRWLDEVIPQILRSGGQV